MTRFKSVALAACLGIFLGPLSLGAQTLTSGRLADARLRLGPLALRPTLEIRDLGVDTNALNASADSQQDVTVTVTPAVEEGLQIWRLAIAGKSSIDWVHFHRLSSQRSLNGSQDGRGELDLGYVRPYLTGAVARTRRRPNLEIDARVERTTISVGGGILFQLGPKLSLDLSQERRTIDFGTAELGVASLADSLNRGEHETRLAGRYALTPLTALVVAAAHRRDRFEYAAERDTDTMATLAGFEFRPLALVAGRASVGWRIFTPLGPALRVFRGLISDVEVSYQVRDVTRLTVNVARDLEYSLELDEPYYVSTGARATVVQAVGSSWDLVGRLGRATLDYRQLVGADAAAPGGRVDTILLAGVGVGRRLGSDVRVGIDIDRAERRSTVSRRNYDGWKLGGSLTYGY